MLGGVLAHMIKPPGMRIRNVTPSGSADNFIRTSQPLRSCSSNLTITCLPHCNHCTRGYVLSRYLIPRPFPEAAGFVVGSNFHNLFRTVSTLIIKIRIQFSRNDACSSTYAPCFLSAEWHHMVPGRSNRIHADISHLHENKVSLCAAQRMVCFLSKCNQKGGTNRSYDHTRHSSQYSTHSFHSSPDTSS